MMKATQAVTSVFWNIKSCPVPPDFDARRVGPCIKRFLEKLGYSGSLTISASGVLEDVPDEVLRAVSSTGIVLDIAPFRHSVLNWSYENEPPANIMVITDPTDRCCCLDLRMLKRQMGFNVIKPYPFGPASTNAECLWKNFLLEESNALEEGIETCESAWVCEVCEGDVTGQGFENFTTHLSSEEHAQAKLGFFPSAAEEEKEKEEEEEEVEPWKWFPPERWFHPHHPPRPRECPFAYPTTMTWQCFPTHQHMFATPSQCPCGYATTMLMIQPQCFPPHPHMFATPSESHGKNEPERKRKKLMK